MRSGLVLSLLLVVAAPAFAGPPAHDPLLDEMLSLGNHTMGGGDTVTVPVAVLPNANPVVGFSISFDFNDAADPFAWASDLRVVVNPPVGPAFSVGGFTTTSDEQYTWFTNVDTNTGSYASGPHYAWDPVGTPKGGIWTFDLRNDFTANGDVQWNNVTVTLHKVPEPASLGLLAIGSLALLRRRPR